MKTTDDVAFILRKLDENGFKSYAVGGCVRDSIMGKEPSDWDIATSAKPPDIKNIFKKTYDTGIKHGTVTVVLNENRYEVTTFRVDGKYSDFRRPETVEFSEKIEDDLKRRDFTINAIAWNNEDGYIDPFNGKNDIYKKLIRGVGDPSERFREDALRMLRAVRFASKLGFEIEKETAEAILENAALIENISAERIREELSALLMSQCAQTVFTKEFISIMEHISHELAMSLEIDRDGLSRLLEGCKKTEALRFAALIYYLDEDSAYSLLKKLKFSNKMYRRIYSLHKVQNVIIGEGYYEVVKKVNDWGEQTFEDYLYFRMLNCIVNNTDLEYTLRIEKNYKLIKENGLPIFISDLAVNGYDLKMEFKITGEALGKTLYKLLDYVHMNPYKNTYNELIKQAYTIILNN